MNIDKEYTDKYEDYINTFILTVGTKFYSIFKKLNFTPNMLTTLSLIFGLISYKFFSIKQFILSSFFYFLSYSFDVLDGNYARHTGLTSKFGDYYDHIKDILIGILIFFAFCKYSIWNKLNFKLLLLIIIITIVLLLTIISELGCREVYYKKKTQKNVSFFFKYSYLFCSKYLNKNLYVNKYIGSGTFTLWICFLIFSNNLDSLMK